MQTRLVFAWTVTYYIFILVLQLVGSTYLAICLSEIRPVYAYVYVTGFGKRDLILASNF